MIFKKNIANNETEYIKILHYIGKKNVGYFIRNQWNVILIKANENINLNMVIKNL